MHCELLTEVAGPPRAMARPLVHILPPVSPSLVLESSSTTCRMSLVEVLMRDGVDCVCWRWRRRGSRAAPPSP
jgi:hypothetical protein